MMNPAAPDGVPPRGGSMTKRKNDENLIVPPCLQRETLMRGNIVNTIFMLRVRT